MNVYKRTEIPLAKRFKWWLSDTFIGHLVVAAAFVAALFGVMLGGAYFMSSRACLSKGEMMGLQMSYTFDTGCMIDIKGQWLPWTSVVPVERDGKIVFVPKPEVHIGK